MPATLPIMIKPAPDPTKNMNQSLSEGFGLNDLAGRKVFGFNDRPQGGHLFRFLFNGLVSFGRVDQQQGQTTDHDQKCNAEDRSIALLMFETVNAPENWPEGAM